MSYNSEVLADSPWGFYKCDEASGATLVDSSGNGRNMTINGAVTYRDPGPVTGVPAIKWPANASVRAETAASNTNSSVTLECWVYLTAYPSGNMPLIGDEQSFGNPTEDKQIGVQSDGKVKFYVYDTTQRILTSPSALSLNAWHHIVGTVGAAGMDLRIDRSVVASNGAVVSSYTGSAQVFFIRPASSWVGLASSGVATITDVAYYTTQLSVARTNVHYDQYVPMAIPVGRATETNFARLLGPTPWKIGSLVSGMAGRWLKNVPQVVSIGRVTETDSARTLLAINGSVQLIPIGRATETDLARHITTVVQIGRATETDSARTLGVSVDLASVVLRIPAGAVGTDLTNFVAKLDLADLPDALWDELGTDGTYIAVRGGTEKPLDLVDVDPGTRTGYGFFRASLQTAVHNDFVIAVRSGIGQPVETDPTGRNAVWSDYDVMVDYSDGLDRTGHGRDPVISGVVGSNFIDSLVHGSMNSSQGIAWDGTNWYGVNTTSIKKYNASFVNTLTVSNTTAVDSRLVHCSGSCVHDGELFVAVSQYPSRLGPIGVAVFDCATLTFSRFYDLTAYVPDASGMCWNADAGCFAVVAGIDNAGTDVYLFDEDFNHLASLVPPRSMPGVQGITYRDGFYYLMSGPIGVSSTLYKLADDMSVATAVWKGGAHLQDLENPGPGTDNLWFSNKSNELRLLTYSAAGADPDDLNWLNLSGFGYAVVTGLPKRTQWTMGATTRLDSVPGAQMPLLSYSSYDGTNGNRAVLYARSTGWTIYNSSDGDAIGGAVVSGDVGARRRLHHTQNGTTDRKLYRQGVLDVTDTGTAQRPGGTDGSEALFLGTEDTDSAEHLLGSLTLVYLRNGVLTPEWLGAEFKSWEGSGFYTVQDGSARTFALGRASETETARALTNIHTVTQAVGRATETDSARALTVFAGAPVTVAVGRASETDLARTLGLAVGPRMISIGRAIETEVARSLTVIVTGTQLAVGRASETDIARGPGMAMKLNMAIDGTEIAMPLTVVKGRFTANLGRVSESDTVGSLTIQLNVPLTRVMESDSAHALGLVLNVGGVGEVELAIPLAVDSTFRASINRAIETEAARALVAHLALARTIGRASEVESVAALGLAVPILRAVQVEQAFSLALIRSIVRVRIMYGGVEREVELLGIKYGDRVIPASVQYWAGGRLIDFEREVV